MSVIPPSTASSSGVIPSLTPSELGKFSAEETEYLMGRLSEYLAAISEGPNKKGDKGNWIDQHILSDFKSRFGYSSDGDGPSPASIKKKLRRWFTNKGKPDAISQSRTIQPAQKPRATNALEIFSEENKDAIAEESRRLVESEGHKAQPPGGSLNTWKQARKMMYDVLDSDEKEKYESRAAEFNQRLKLPPDASVIYKNQTTIIPKITRALMSLSGWDWGKCGPLVCFVQAAYRDEQERLKIVNVSVSDDIRMKAFPPCLPDYENFCEHFKKWATASLPEKPPPTIHSDDVHTLISISYDEDKFPRLMLPEDLEDVTVKMIKNALTVYMVAAWEHARPCGFSTSIPWRLLKAAKSRLFVDPDRLATFPLLDPAQLLGDDAFRMLRLVSDAQLKHERSPLKFALTVDTLNALDRGDELCDSIDAPLLPIKTTDSCDKGKGKGKGYPAAAAGDDSLSSSDPTSEREDAADGNTVTEDRASSVASDVLRDAGEDTCDTNPKVAPGAAGDSSVVSDVSMGAGDGTNDNNASIAEQDGGDDSDKDEPSTSIPVTRQKARKKSAMTPQKKAVSVEIKKRARHEENVTTDAAPRKKGKWADLPARTSQRIRHDGYVHSCVGKKQ